MRNCKFDGVEGWRLARHHHDAAIYFLDCSFTKTIADMKPYRVIYPLNGGTPTDADKVRNADLDKTNIWGDRVYFYNSHKDGGDLPWMANNLDKATGAPKPEQITANWTFAGTWDPEDKTGPKFVEINRKDGQIQVKYSESVTVKGKPFLKQGGAQAAYESGSGSDTLVFAAAGTGDVGPIDLNGGAIIATQASATVRNAELKK
jgi:pectinesterase